VGIKATDAALGLNGTNLWIYPSLDHDANVARFANDIDSPFASLYISFPSSKDPDFANRCPGRSTVEVLTFVPFEAFASWRDTKWKRRGAAYDSLKQNLRQGSRQRWSGTCPPWQERLIMPSCLLP